MSYIIGKISKLVSGSAINSSDYFCKVLYLQALWNLDILPPCELVYVAAEALLLGLDSDGALELSGLADEGNYNYNIAFQKMLRELNVPVLDIVTSIKLYIKHIAEDMASGNLGVVDGSRAISSAISGRVCVAEVPEYHTFLYFDSEAAERSDFLDSNKEIILQEAIAISESKYTLSQSGHLDVERLDAHRN